jgi:hypothetical protein
MLKFLLFPKKMALSFVQFSDRHEVIFLLCALPALLSVGNIISLTARLLPGGSRNPVFLSPS